MWTTWGYWKYIEAPEEAHYMGYLERLIYVIAPKETHYVCFLGRLMLYYSPKEAHFVDYFRRLICYSPQGVPLYGILWEIVS